MKSKTLIAGLIMAQAVTWNSPYSIAPAFSAVICKGPAAYPPDLPSCLLPVYINKGPAGKNLKAENILTLKFEKKSSFQLVRKETAAIELPDISKGTRVDIVVYTPGGGIYPLASFSAKKNLKNYRSPVIQFNLKGNYRVLAFVEEFTAIANIQIK